MVSKLRDPGLMRPANVAKALAMSLVVGACSLSFPLPGFVDRSPTGSIKDTDAGPVLSSALDREDLRRARAALAVALDPQGNGTNVAWSNPDTGAGGSFVALAPPFPDHEGICRSFSGNILVRAHAKRRIVGSACRASGADWSIAEISDRT